MTSIIPEFTNDSSKLHSTESSKNATVPHGKLIHSDQGKRTRIPVNSRQFERGPFGAEFFWKTSSITGKRYKVYKRNHQHNETHAECKGDSSAGTTISNVVNYDM